MYALLVVFSAPLQLPEREWGLCFNEIIPTVELLGSLLVVEVGRLLPDLVLGQLLSKAFPVQVVLRDEEVTVLKPMPPVQVRHGLRQQRQTRYYLLQPRP